jgi:hypothetical protein
MEKTEAMGMGNPDSYRRLSKNHGAERLIHRTTRDPGETMAEMSLLGGVPTMKKHLRELLAEYAALLNERGIDSPEAAELIVAHRWNREFVELAQLSRELKKALTAPGDGDYRTRRSTVNRQA